MNIVRALRHSFALPFAFRQQFNKPALANIEAAIAQAEAQAGLQIRFVAEHTLPWRYCLRNHSPRARALSLFGKLRVWDTETNNGVMIYVQWLERKVEIIADRTAARALPQETWNAFAAQAAKAMQKEPAAAGIGELISAIAATLAAQLTHQSNASAMSNQAVILD